MTPRNARTAALTIGGALVLTSAAGMTAAQAADTQTPAGTPTIGQTYTWTALEDYTRTEFKQAAATTESPYATATTDSGQALPLAKYEVGNVFGIADAVHTGGVHSGVDMSAPTGTEIYAIEGGKVIAAEWQGAAGKAVTIKTNDGYSVLYGHMNSMAVSTGDKVETGQKIGRVGSTGNSTGPHLHLGVHNAKGRLMDPLVWMDITAKELRQFSK
jgi:murein DD-endopeptidase MepM/ murein hydrolase activator NlpD